MNNDKKMFWFALPLMLALYALLSFVGHWSLIHDSGIWLIWCNNALLWATLIYLPFRHWKIVVPASIIVGIFVSAASYEAPYFVYIAGGINDSIEATVAAAMVRYFIREKVVLDSPKAMIKLIFLGFLPPALLLNGPIGTGLSVAAFGVDFFVTYQIWVFGVVLGYISIGIPLLAWFPVLATKSLEISRLKLLEWLALCTLTTVTSILTFGNFGFPDGYIIDVPIFLWLFVIWSGLRFELPLAVVSPMLITLIVIVYTIEGSGPFVDDSTTTTAISLQIYLYFINLTAQLLAVIVKNMHRAINQLKETEEKYRTVANFTYDWEYWKNPDCEMVYVSPSFERITGYPVQKIIDDPTFLTSIILSEDKEKWNSHVVNPHADSMSSIPVQFRIKRKDGSICWIEHVCRTVYDEMGKNLGIRASNRDITDRKKAEMELRKKSEMLEESQKIARLGSWEWDIVKNSLIWSEEVYRIFGLSSQEFDVTFQAFIEMIHPEDRRMVEDAVERSMADPAAEYTIRHRIVTPEGLEKVVQKRGEIIVDDSGQAIRMVGTVQDVTDIRSMETEVHKTRMEISHMDRVGTMAVLSAGISHEINQPLGAILNNAQAALRFLASDQPDLKEVKEALQDIVSDDKRAGEIVHSIRNLMSNSDQKLTKINLNETVLEVILLIKSDVLKQNISLSKDLQSNIPSVFGSRVQIQQVILNLFMNALDAVSKNTVRSRNIMIATEFKKNNEVLLSVSDSGPGIEKELLETVFESFQTTKKGGLGIGLSICRTIAREHQGAIWAENRPQGGAVFYFKLPANGNQHG